MLIAVLGCVYLHFTKKSTSDRYAHFLKITLKTPFFFNFNKIEVVAAEGGIIVVG